jgi:hypothetical protein
VTEEHGTNRCLKAMASGLTTIDFRHNHDVFPRVDELTLGTIKNSCKRNREFIERNHSVEIVAKTLMETYYSLEVNTIES